MQQQVRRMSAAGRSPWIMLDTRRKWFGAGLAVLLSDGATLTYTVQHTYDPLHEYTTEFSAFRVTTTLTIRKVNHGLVVGDWFNIQGAGAPIDGEHTVASVVDADNVTATVVDSGQLLPSHPGSRIVTARVFPHDEADLVAETASANGNYAYPVAATRLLVSAYTDGFADYTVLQQGA